MSAADDTPPCTLYLITPPKIAIAAFADTLSDTLAAAPEAIGALQLRLKNVGDDEILRAAHALLPICHGFDIPLIVNDRPDLAKQAGADGVHIGQDDGSYKDARKLLGDDAVIGVTCHDSRDLAIDAGEAGADYVAFGAFFPSATKEVKHHADTDIIEWWSTMTVIPCVAIGGITVENCAPLVRAGADYLAVVGGVWDFPDGPEAAARAFAAEIAANSRD
jgi:thiamine-phosphate pyrophosphorylase